MLHQPENCIEVDGQCVAPLLIGQLIDGRVIGRPHAVVSNENIELSKALDGCLDQFSRVGRSIQINLHRRTVGLAALAHQLLRHFLRLLIVEQNFGPGSDKHHDRCGSNATGAASDKGDLVGEI